MTIFIVYYSNSSPNNLIIILSFLGVELTIRDTEFLGGSSSRFRDQLSVNMSSKSILKISNHVKRGNDKIRFMEVWRVCPHDQPIQKGVIPPAGC
jgi:hypothetical protein